MDDTNKVKRFFSVRAGKFDSYYSKDKPGLWRFLDYLFRQSMYRRFVRTLEEASRLKNPSVLDIGCGAGRYSMALARTGAVSVLGIDFSHPMITRARRMAENSGAEKNCEFVCGNFLEYQFMGMFDVTIATGYFDYLKEPLPHLNKMRYLTLKKAIMTFPSRWHLRNIVRKIRLFFLGCPVYFYDRQQIEKLLRAANFKSFRIENLGRDYFVVAEV
ncbi:MAG: methyltransferase domain-containing protein [Candidatus Omnitrophota bacterium]|nr:methyltransferase domain-containing protein [Candidatus Omnitrophota bacterium]